MKSLDKIFWRRWFLMPSNVSTTLCKIAKWTTARWSVSFSIYSMNKIYFVVSIRYCQMNKYSSIIIFFFSFAIHPFDYVLYITYTIIQLVWHNLVIIILNINACIWMYMCKKIIFLLMYLLIYCRKYVILFLVLFM